MASAAKKLATYQDVLRAPMHQIAEVVDGELRLQPRPAGRHARASWRLGGSLDEPFDRGRGGPGGWIFAAEPELHVGAEPYILVPDIAGWRRDRVPALADAPYQSATPDWVCELLSPSTSGFDRGRKADVWLEVGVKHLWLVDPDVPQIEAFESDGARWVRLGAYAQAGARIVPFDAVAIDVPSLVEAVETKTG